MVLLENQDRSLWDRARIAEGVELLDRSLCFRPAGPYQIQAAIAALHAQDQTDWPQIAALYGVLAVIHPSPVVELNRAAAVAMADGLERGLAMLDTIDLPGYHLLPAARADLLRRLGLPARAAEAYREALALVTNDAERRYLEKRLAEVTGTSSPR
jgi:RNA polymerase sigma-70 factor, ECF subfamily